MRIVRMLRFLGALRMLVLSIVTSMKFVGWTFALISLMLYVISVCFTQVVTDSLQDMKGPNQELLSRHFGTLGSSFQTLFQSITGGIDWAIVSSALAESVSPLLAPIFSGYVAFALLAMFNIVTGELLQSSLKSAKDENESFFIECVREVFKKANGGSIGNLTWEDFQKQLGKAHVQHCLKAVDVNPCEARGLFNLLDLDNSGTIDAEEFLSGCLRIRGPAKALELVLLMREVRSMSEDLKKYQKSTESRLEALGLVAPLNEDCVSETPFPKSGSSCLQSKEGLQEELEGPRLGVPVDTVSAWPQMNGQSTMSLRQSGANIPTVGSSTDRALDHILGRTSINSWTR